MEEIDTAKAGIIGKLSREQLQHSQGIEQHMKGTDTVSAGKRGSTGRD
jgi:hypothetical protein